MTREIVPIDLRTPQTSKTTPSGEYTAIMFEASQLPVGQAIKLTFDSKQDAIRASKAIKNAATRKGIRHLAATYTDQVLHVYRTA